MPAEGAERARRDRAEWKQWGPYLSERASGTVRADYSTAACRQAAEVDRGEPGVLEQRSHRGLGVGIVPGDEDHAPAPGLLRVGAEHVGAEGVAGLHNRSAGDEVGDELTRGSPIQVVGAPVVGRVDDGLAVPFEAS